MHKVTLNSRIYKYWEYLLVYHTHALKRCDDYHSQWFTQSPRVRQLTERIKSVLQESPLSLISLCAQLVGTKYTLRFSWLVNKQAFWSGRIEAVTSPLGIFRSFLFQIRCSGPCLQRESSPWLASVSKATDQPNKAAGGGGAGRAAPGAAEPSLPAASFWGSSW